MSGIPTLIIIAAVMFCILGGISVVAHLYNLNSIKSKTVGDGQHGTARWATKSEIRKIYRHIPFTPNKWRKQAADGETPTASRIVKRRLFKSKKKNSRKKLCRRALWLVAQAANTIQQHLWIQEMSMC